MRMGTLKRWGAAALCAALACGLCACSMVEVNEERDNAQVVATVNGADILKEDYYLAFANMLYNYGMTAEQMEQEDEETAKSYRTSVLSELVNNELLYQEAVKQGLVDDSDEKKAEYTTSAQESMDQMLTYYRDTVNADSTIPEADKEAEAQKLMDGYKEQSGLTDLDAYVQDQIRQAAMTAMYDKIVADVTYTEEQAKEYYDLQVESQQSAMEKDPANYGLYTSFGTSYVNPDGYKSVKNLLIGLSDDVQAEIDRLRADGNEAEADALYEEELAKIKPQAEDALKRARDGEDFDALIEELGTDTGMQAEPAKTYGYTVYEGSEFVPEFEAASLALQNEGDISELVPTAFGYHIIKYVKDASGPIPFDTVKEDMISAQLNSAKSTAYYQYIEDLKEQSDIKEYPNRLTNAG